MAFRVMCSSVDITASCEVEDADRSYEEPVSSMNGKRSKVSVASSGSDILGQGMSLASDADVADIGRSIEQQTEVRISSNSTASTSAAGYAAWQQGAGRAHVNGKAQQSMPAANGARINGKSAPSADSLSSSPITGTSNSHHSNNTASLHQLQRVNPNDADDMQVSNSGVLDRPQRNIPASPPSPSPAAYERSMTSTASFEYDTSSTDDSDEDEDSTSERRRNMLRAGRIGGAGKQLRQVRAVSMRLVPISKHSITDPDQLEAAGGTSNSHGVELPLLGPWLLTNSPETFPVADAVVEHSTERNERLAIRLEYIEDRYDLENAGLARLHLFNISRVVRNRQQQACVLVNGRSVSKEGSLVLSPGDVVQLGTSENAPKFQLEAIAQPDPAANPIQQALSQYCSQAGGQQQAPGPQAVAGRRRAAPRDPRAEAAREEAGLQEQLVKQPNNPSKLLWLKCLPLHDLLIAPCVSACSCEGAWGCNDAFLFYLCSDAIVARVV